MGIGGIFGTRNQVQTSGMAARVHETWGGEASPFRDVERSPRDAFEAGSTQAHAANESPALPESAVGNGLYDQLLEPEAADAAPRAENAEGVELEAGGDEKGDIWRVLVHLRDAARRGQPASVTLMDQATLDPAVREFTSSWVRLYRTIGEAERGVPGAAQRVKAEMRGLEATFETNAGRFPAGLTDWFRGVTSHARTAAAGFDDKPAAGAKLPVAARAFLRELQSGARPTRDRAEQVAAQVQRELGARDPAGAKAAAHAILALQNARWNVGRIDADRVMNVAEQLVNAKELKRVLSPEEQKLLRTTFAAVAGKQVAHVQGESQDNAKLRARAEETFKKLDAIADYVHEKGYTGLTGVAGEAAKTARRYADRLRTALDKNDLQAIRSHTNKGEQEVLRFFGPDPVAGVKAYREGFFDRMERLATAAEAFPGWGQGVALGLKSAVTLLKAGGGELTPAQAVTKGVTDSILTALGPIIARGGPPAQAVKAFVAKLAEIMAPAVVGALSNPKLTNAERSAAIRGAFAKAAVESMNDAVFAMIRSGTGMVGGKATHELFVDMANKLGMSQDLKEPLDNLEKAIQSGQ